MSLLIPRILGGVAGPAFRRHARRRPLGQQRGGWHKSEEQEALGSEGPKLEVEAIGRVGARSRATGLSYSRMCTPHRKRDVSRPEASGDVAENRVWSDRYGHWAKPHSGILGTVPVRAAGCLTAERHQPGPLPGALDGCAHASRQNDRSQRARIQLHDTLTRGRVAQPHIEGCIANLSPTGLEA